MRYLIGHVQLNGNRELNYYFDKTTEHSWTGPKVKIAKVEIFIEYNISYLLISKPVTVGVTKTIIFSITDELGRNIEKQSNIGKLRESIKNEQFGYCLGWSDGPTKVILNDNAEDFLNAEVRI